MKFKQIFFTVAISAVTAFAVIWGYGTYLKKNNSYAGQQAGVVPANYKYAGFFGGSNPPGNTIDFTAPAEAATPAVVHIKTKTNAKQVNNSLRNWPMKYWTKKMQAVITRPLWILVQLFANRQSLCAAIAHYKKYVWRLMKAG